MWEQAYTYYYVPIRNITSELDDQPKAIQAMFTNISKVALDFVVIVGYERSFNINVSNGQFPQALEI
jgi:hypothetical protein